MKTTYARAGVTTLAALGLAFAGTTAHAQTTIFAGWNFDNYTPPTATSTGPPATKKGSLPNSSPSASTGSGVASTLGMANTYGTPGTSVDVSDIYNTGTADDGSGASADEGSSDPSQTTTTSNIWRIRGGEPTGGSAAANGWSSSAPAESQGAQFLTSTAGYSTIGLSFDWYDTTQGVGDLQVQYTTDGSTWTNIGSVISASTGASSTVGGKTTTGVKGQNWYDGQAYDFSSITAANNDSNFGVRMVNAYTGSAEVSASDTALNNTSGNWRFDEVNFSGTPTVTSAAPEPSQYAGLTFFLLGLTGLAFRARKRASAAAAAV